MMQAVEWKLLASLSALNILQTVIVWCGLSSGLIVCVRVTPPPPPLPSLPLPILILASSFWRV